MPSPMPPDDAVTYATFPFRSCNGAGCENFGSGGRGGRAGGPAAGAAAGAGGAGVSAIRASNGWGVMAAEYASATDAPGAKRDDMTKVRRRGSRELYNQRVTDDSWKQLDERLAARKDRFPVPRLRPLVRDARA